MELGNNGAYGPVLQVNSLPATRGAVSGPGIAGLFSTLVAWQQTPGTTGPPEIRVRYEPRASTLGPEQVLSSPGRGPGRRRAGARGHRRRGGDAAVAWVQGAPGSNQIVVDQLYQPPGSATVSRKLSYSRSAQPVLRWSAVERSLGTDHLRRERRRDPGRRRPGATRSGSPPRSPTAGTAGRSPRATRPGLTGVFQGRGGVRRHGGAGGEGDRVGSAGGGLKRGPAPLLP